jgi:putative hydrolase of the HAD superfamily
MLGGSDAVAAVLFDLDGTLTDREATLRRYAGCFVERFGARLKETTLEVVTAELRRVDRDGYNVQRARDLAELALWRDSPGPEVLQAHWSQEFSRLTAARDGYPEVVQRLAGAGLRLGVITNGPAESQRAKIGVLGLSSWVEVALVSGELGFAKPDPRIFAAAAGALQLPPARCLFVGDHPDKDVQGSLDAGMQAVWIRGAVHWPAGRPAPAFAIDGLLELLQHPALRALLV